jgi:hypothetical protein
MTPKEKAVVDAAKLWREHTRHYTLESYALPLRRAVDALDAAAPAPEGVEPGPGAHAKIEKLNQRVNGLEYQIGKRRFEELAARIAALEADANPHQLVEHENAIGALAGKVRALESRSFTVNERLADMLTRIEDLEAAARATPSPYPMKDPPPAPPPPAETAPKTRWFVFAHGNDVPFGQDMGFFRGVPGGVYFRTEDKGESIFLCAPGYGLHGHPEVQGHSLYGNGAICVQRKDLDEALRSGQAEEQRLRPAAPAQEGT